MRIHLFEWEDQPWFPSVLRDNMTDFLRNMILWQKIYEPSVDILLKLIHETKEKQIVDLCSGAGGGIEAIAKEVNKKSREKIQFILTDKFPNEDVIKYLSEINYISYYPNEVDALHVLKELNGIRTLYSSFHHFKPDQAKQILQDATKNSSAIAVFEGAGKTLMEFIAFMLIFPVAIFFITPFIKPFKWSRIIFTYLIPLLPFIIYWDGLVSILRMYNLKDLDKLTKSFDNHFAWKYGKLKGKYGVVTYLYGVRK